MTLKKRLRDLTINPKLKQVRNYLLKELKDYGILVWHISSSNKSIYLKFRDHRVGTIRLSNHEKKGCYEFCWELDYTNSTKTQADGLVWAVKEKIKTLENFNPNTYIVFNRRIHKFVKVKNIEEYRRQTMHPTLY